MAKTFQIQSTALVSAFKRIASVVPDKPILPAYGALKFKATGSDEIFVTASNPTLVSKTSIKASIQEPMEFGTNATVFVKVISALPKDQMVTFNLADTHVKVTAGNASFKINIFYDMETLLRDRNYEEMGFVDINVRDFLDNTKKVSFVRNEDSDKPEFSSVCVNSDHFVSTDGYRLSYAPNKLLKIPPEIGNILLPGEAADRLYKLFDKVDGASGRFFGNDSDITIHYGDTYASCRRVSGKFPMYQSVLSDLLRNQHTRCLVKRADMVDSLSRILTISSAKGEGSRQVELSFAENALKLYTVDQSRGDATDIISCECPGVSESMLFSGKYLLETLKHYESDSLVLELRGPQRPLLITDGTHVNIIMPVAR